MMKDYFRKRPFASLSAGLVSVLLAACATTRALEERFVTQAPDGWVVADQETSAGVKTTAYVPQGQSMQTWTQQFRTQVYADMRYTTIGSFSTSLLDSGKQYCPDLSESRSPDERENGFDVLNTAFFCPYADQMGGGVVTVTKLIHGKDNIYMAEFVFRVQRFNPGEKPKDIDIENWETMLKSVQVCQVGVC